MGERLDAQEDLVHYFERVTGHGMKTKEDLERYFDCAREVRPQWVHLNRLPRGGALLRQVVLAVLFVIVAVQYVSLDVLVEIASLPHTTYFIASSASS